MVDPGVAAEHIVEPIHRPWLCCLDERALELALHERLRRGRTFGLLLGLIFVSRVLLEVEVPQPVGLLDEGQLLAVSHLLPLPTQSLGDLRVVYVGLVLDDFPALVVREHHEGVHRSLDLHCVMARLKYI